MTYLLQKMLYHVHIATLLIVLGTYSCFRDRIILEQFILFSELIINVFQISNGNTYRNATLYL